MSYRKLEIWHLAKQVSIEIHAMSLQELPKFELYEVGSQIRRSSKSIAANIAEGYGRRKYQQDYIRFVVYALSSCDETMNHLDILYSTGSLKNDVRYQQIQKELIILGKKLNVFLQTLENRSPQVRETIPQYLAPSNPYPSP